jgi:hypothetical protein
MCNSWQNHTHYSWVDQGYSWVAKVAGCFGPQVTVTLAGSGGRARRTSLPKIKGKTPRSSLRSATASKPDNKLMSSCQCRHLGRVPRRSEAAGVDRAGVHIVRRQPPTTRTASRSTPYSETAHWKTATLECIGARWTCQLVLGHARIDVECGRGD